MFELINRLEQKAFTERDKRSLQTIAEYAAIAITNAELYQRKLVPGHHEDVVSQ